ncbi:hypothetical protein A2U01_0118960, partial [Trifolium medium]|nr:hypothetical protein [Trifolium medium]
SAARVAGTSRYWSGIARGAGPAARSAG